MKTSVTLIAPKEVSDCAPNLSFQGRFAFWLRYFLRREALLAKQVPGLIKPYTPKVRAAKSNQLLLTGSSPLSAPPAEIVVS